jgi:hypothetical protein
MVIMMKLIFFSRNLMSIHQIDDNFERSRGFPIFSSLNSQFSKFSYAFQCSKEEAEELKNIEKKRQ